MQNSFQSEIQLDCVLKLALVQNDFLCKLSVCLKIDLDQGSGTFTNQRDVLPAVQLNKTLLES